MTRKILLTGFLIAAAAFAQGRGGGGGGRRNGGMDMGGGLASGPTNRLELMSDLFQLNKDQRKDFKTALDEAQKEATGLREQITKSREAIAAAVQSGKVQDGLAPLFSSHAALEAQMTDVELKSFLTLVKTFTPEQRPHVQRLYQMMKGLFTSGKNWNSLQ